MKQVWKCGFCSETDVDPEVIAEHEKNCSFNPATKLCWTCTHRTTEGAPLSGFWNGCAAGVPLDAQMEVEERRADCPYWEAEGKQK